MRNRETVISILRPVCGALVLCAIMLILSAVFSSLPDVSWPFVKVFLISLYVLVPYTVSLFLVDRVKSLPVYILLAALPVILILVFPAPSMLKAMMFVVSGLLVAIRANSRIRQEEDFTQKPGAVALILFVVAYFAGISFKLPAMMKISYYMAFAYAILLIIYKNFSKLNQYLVFNKDVENIPYDQISRTNYGTLTIYLVLTIGLMVILPVIGIDRLLSNFGDAMKDLLARLLNREIDYGSATEASKETETMFSMENPLSYLVAKDAPAWLKAFYQVLTWIATAAVIGGFLFALVVFAMKMMKQFYRSEKNSTDRNEFIRAGKDEKNFLLRTPTTVTRVREWLDRSPNAQVRRAYKKAVLKHGKEAPEAFMTPREAEEFVGFPDNKERRTLHRLYEKARYSEDGCTRDDVRLLKE